ncbi:MAG: FtsQ-type POTRA domain-containing protein [Burkholderiales bacterium]|nr:MAG: FtsQ-type POTRA domain-containing protein [Burkholderiales bacterium]TAG81738.1 MAG: FtsQ-type POTRA domain-containing protein [Betaproteobacteria bacterium]
MNDHTVLSRLAGWIALVASIAIAWSIFQWANGKGWFALRQVAFVSQPVELDVGLLESAVRTEVRGTFFTVSPQRVRTTLRKLPWVRDAVVERRWPFALDVRVEEYRAVGYWGELDLLSDRGELFRATSRAPLPRFDGPAEMAAETLQRYREMKVVLAPLGLTIRSMNVSPRGAVSVTMKNGLVVELGRDSIEQRLTRFIGLYTAWSAEERDSIARVDLRYKSAVAVARGRTSSAASTSGDQVAVVGTQQ